MKYGLRSDNSKRSKWKISVEQDIAKLKMEVCSLKLQLKSSLDIISFLLPKESSKSSTKGLKDVSDGTMFLKYSPTLANDPANQKYGRFHCIITKDKSLEELRLEDYILNSRIFNQNTSFKGGFTMEQNLIDRMPVEGTHSHVQDETLSQIKSHLGKINNNMTILTSQLSKMDNNLSEINSQMSVMDSRLSAIDMFVTMQQVDKRWQELTARLQTIENSPEISELSNKNDIKESLSPQDSVLFNNSMEKLCNSSQAITTKDNVFMSNSSNCANNLGDKSSEIEKTDPLNCYTNCVASFENAKFEKDKLSNNCSSQTSDYDRPENSNLQNLAKINVCKSGSDTEQQSSSTPVSSKSGSEEVHDSHKLPPLTSEHSKENIVYNKIKKHTAGEDSSDVENEFVFIEKSEIDLVCDQRAEEGKNKTCSNITEYLEESLIKKKDSVYEFSFNIIDQSDIGVPCYQGTEEAKSNTCSNINACLKESLVEKKDSVNEIRFNKYKRWDKRGQK